MEHCPNCGTPGRPGAKFCTTCGFRFPGDESDGEPAHDHPDATAPNTDEESGLFPGAMTDGWPSPPPPAETAAAGWDDHGAGTEATAAEPAEMTEAEGSSDSWAVSATDSWPAPPTTDVADTPPTEPKPEPQETIETASGDDSDAAAANQTETTEAMARAMRLLDEPRPSIAELGPQSAVDRR